MTCSPHGTESAKPRAIDTAPPLEIDTQPEPRGVRLRLRGALDLATVGGIRGAIDECVSARIGRVVLDLRDVTFLDSTGLHLILAADATARAAGCELQLIQGPPAVQRIFELAGVGDRLLFAERSPAPMDSAGRRFAPGLAAHRALGGRGHGG